MLEVRGAYITASMFQPFTFRDFPKQLPRIFRHSLFVFRPGSVLSQAYTDALKLKKTLVSSHEAAYLVAGLGLLAAGIGLQILAGALLLWAEFQSSGPHSP